MNTHGFQLPVYIAKSIYTAGHVADLGPLQLAIFDKKTNYVATGTGNGKEFYLAGGSPHTVDQLSKWFKGMKQRKESTPFAGRDIEGFEKIMPSRPANEAWVIGYGGAKNDPTLKYELDHTYKLRIRLYGDPAFYFAQNSVDKIIPLYTGCTSLDDCSVTCESAKVGVKAQTRAWVKAINSNIQLAEFKIKAQPIFSDYAATSSTLHNFTLTIADGGGVNKLQDVQRAYPALKISLKSFANGVSVYETTALASSPAAYTAPAFSVPVTNCNECTAGTFVDAQDVYVISRPLAGTEDFSTPTTQATYAATVKGNYTGATTASFMSFSGSVANVKLVFPKGTAVAAYLADNAVKIATNPPTCTTVAGSAINWAQGTGAYTVTRTLTLTVSNEDCSNPATLAAVQAHLAALKNSVTVTDITDSTGSGIDADHCVTVFQAVQTSFPMVDEYCMTADNVSFETLPNFKGAIWIENDTTDVYDASIKAGIRITAPFYSKEFGDYSYDLNERWDAQPLRMELSIYNDEGIEPCKFADYAKARRVKAPKYQRLSGGYVRHEYIVRNSAYFPYEKWAVNPRARETADTNVLDQVKGNVYYVEYRLKYKELRDTENFNQKKQHWSPRIFVEEGDRATQVALEAAFGAITSKFDIELQNVGSF